MSIWGSSGLSSSDVAAIAAAVAAAIEAENLPTAAEIAAVVPDAADITASCAAAIVAAGLATAADVAAIPAAVGAQAACAAAITAASLPTAAQVATAVGAQAACEAAITARSTALAAAITGGGYATTHALVYGDGLTVLGNVGRTCVFANESTRAADTAAIVAAVPDAADITTIVGGALEAKLPTLSEVIVPFTLSDNPVALIAAVGGQTIRVYSVRTGLAGGGASVFLGFEDSDGNPVDGSLGTAFEIGFAPLNLTNDNKPLWTLPVGKGLRLVNPGFDGAVTISYTQG